MSADAGDADIAHGAIEIGREDFRPPYRVFGSAAFIGLRLRADCQQVPVFSNRVINFDIPNHQPIGVGVEFDLAGAIEDNVLEAEVLDRADADAEVLVAAHFQVRLNDPDQLRRANCERIVLRFQSFYCFMNRTLEAPLFEMPADGVLKRLQERTNQFNRNRQRGGGAAVCMYEFGNEVAFLIRFGGSLKRDEVMDNDQCRPDIRRPVGYDLVVYNIETGELRIRADLVSERRFYCRLFSEQLFDDPEFFEHGETFNLDVIYRLGEDVQSPGMIFGIKRVTLVEIQEVLLGEKTLHVTFKSEAIFDAIREHNKRLTPTGRLLSAKFRIILEDADEVTVTVCSGNKIRLSRQVGTASIDRWMIHIGIRVPQHETLRMQASSPLASHLANPKSKGPDVSVASRTG